MERPLTNFIRALRSSEVRVSTGEALDAAHTLKLIGYADRSMLKNSLANPNRTMRMRPIHLNRKPMHPTSSI